MNEVVENQLIRLGIPLSGIEQGMKNLNEWASQVREIESDNNPMAVPRNKDGTLASSAKGVYQFLDGSVPVAKQRMLNAGYPEDYVNSINNNPQEWSPEQADAMFFGNMFSQADSDSLLREIALGNQNARREAYYRFHHTNPDASTIKRTEGYIPVLEQPVDDLMEDYNKTQKAFN